MEEALVTFVTMDASVEPVDSVDERLARQLAETKNRNPQEGR